MTIDAVEVHLDVTEKTEIEQHKYEWVTQEKMAELRQAFTCTVDQGFLTGAHLSTGQGTTAEARNRSVVVMDIGWWAGSASDKEHPTRWPKSRDFGLVTRSFVILGSFGCAYDSAAKNDAVSEALYAHKDAETELVRALLASIDAHTQSMGGSYIRHWLKRQRSGQDALSTEKGSVPSICVLVGDMHVPVIGPNDGDEIEIDWDPSSSASAVNDKTSTKAGSAPSAEGPAAPAEKKETKERHWVKRFGRIPLTPFECLFEGVDSLEGIVQALDQTSWGAEDATWLAPSMASLGVSDAGTTTLDSGTFGAGLGVGAAALVGENALSLWMEGSLSSWDALGNKVEGSLTTFAKDSAKDLGMSLGTGVGLGTGLAPRLGEMFSKTWSKSHSLEAKASDTFSDKLRGDSKGASIPKRAWNALQWGFQKKQIEEDRMTVSEAKRWRAYYHAKAGRPADVFGDAGKDFRLFVEGLVAFHEAHPDVLRFVQTGDMLDLWVGMSPSYEPSAGDYDPVSVSARGVSFIKHWVANLVKTEQGRHVFAAVKRLEETLGRAKGTEASGRVRYLYGNHDNVLSHDAAITFPSAVDGRTPEQLEKRTAFVKWDGVYVEHGHQYRTARDEAPTANSNAASFETMLESVLGVPLSMANAGTNAAFLRPRASRSLEPLLTVLTSKGDFKGQRVAQLEWGVGRALFEHADTYVMAHTHSPCLTKVIVRGVHKADEALTSKGANKGTMLAFADADKGTTLSMSGPSASVRIRYAGLPASASAHGSVCLSDSSGPIFLADDAFTHRPTPEAPVEHTFSSVPSGRYELSLVHRSTRQRLRKASATLLVSGVSVELRGSYKRTEIKLSELSADEGGIAIRWAEAPREAECVLSLRPPIPLAPRRHLLSFPLAPPGHKETQISGRRVLSRSDLERLLGNAKPAEATLSLNNKMKIVVALMVSGEAVRYPSGAPMEATFTLADDGLLGLP